MRTRLLPVLSLPLLLGLGFATCSQGSAAPIEELPFDQDRAWAHLERIVAFGERPSGSPANARLRDHLVKELETLGLQPVRESFTDMTPVGEVAFENLYADLPPPGQGETKDAPLIVLGSHFDTKRMSFRFVGANDGGSSTAVLLELARILTASKRPRDYTYRFLFFDGEEALRSFWADPDNTYGSRHHVAQLVASGEIERVKAMVLLDMVGDKRLRLTTDDLSTPALLKLFFDVGRELGLDQHVAGPRKTVLDDHLPFINAGVPSVDLIDLEFGPANMKWHTHEDTLENCSKESLGIVGRIVLAGLPRLEDWLDARSAGGR